MPRTSFSFWLAALSSLALYSAKAAEYGKSSFGFIDPKRFTVDLNMGNGLPGDYKSAADKGLERDVRVAALLFMLNSSHWKPDVLKLGEGDDPKRLDSYIKDGKLTLNLSGFFDGNRLGGFLSGEPYPYACTQNGLPGPGEGFRLDWMIAQFAKFDHYKNILGFPKNVRDLAKTVGVSNQFMDPNQIYGAIGRDARGNPESGVSLGDSRVFETAFEKNFAGRGGDHHWRRTYDTVFNPKRGDDAAERNFFTHPTSFTADGSEIIFHLPNFFNGWVLANGNGDLIAEAPIDLVKNRMEPDYGEVLKVPFSCMTCHASNVDIGSGDYDVRSRLKTLKDALDKKAADRKRLTADEKRALAELNWALTNAKLEDPEARKALAKEHDAKTHASIEKAGAFVKGALPPSAAARLIPDFAMVYEVGLSPETLAREMSSAGGKPVTADEINAVLNDPANLLLKEKLGSSDKGFARRMVEVAFCELKAAIEAQRAAGAAPRSPDSSAAPGTEKIENGSTNETH